MADESPAIRVLVADDHPLYRDGVSRALVAAGFVVVGEASTGEEALSLLRSELPDVALVDYRLPPPDGVEVVATALRERLPTRIVVLSAYAEADLVYKALEAGAAGFLIKEARRQEIAAAVRSCAAGETVLSPELTTGVAGEIRRRQGPTVVLSVRELEILDLIAAGKSLPKIGQELHVSTSTVKTHVQRLYEKLNVGDRAAAVAEGMRRGLIE